MGITDEANRFRQGERWTTIVLQEEDSGRWLATQEGVPVEGHGETAAAAATEYCRKVSEGTHE